MNRALPGSLLWGLTLVVFLLFNTLFTSRPLEAQPASPDLEVNVWARQPMLRNPVAISHDPMGRLYATEANRRRSVDLDVRGMKALEPYPWPVLDYSIQSVDQRRAIIREYLAPESRFSNPWLKDYDENGEINWLDLTAKTERVNLLEDTDGDGTADKAIVFAEGFDTEVTGTAGGILWHDGQVFFTVIPDLWRLTDTDGNGRADQKTVLHTGHGVHIGQGGHDLHALTLGPDGRIYWTVGDKGINITSREGNHFFYPNQGVLMRSEPDGSNFEVFAHGLRNCQEITFDDFGNLFCVDNDGDFRGERERLVYITQGSDTGWRINWQYNHTNAWAESQRLPDYNPWMKERLWESHFEGQAAYITPALSNYSDGPAGLKKNPGTALSTAYSDYYLHTQFPGKLITAFQLQPRGAAFEMVNEHTFHKGFMAVGMSFSPKGELFVADWAGDWYPTEDGAIVRIDVPEKDRHPMRSRTEQLIREGMAGRDTAELLALLDYPDQRIRLNAQFELVSRNDSEALSRTAFDTGAPQFARVHAIWGLGQIARKKSLDLGHSLDALLRDTDSQVKIQSGRLALELPGLFEEAEPLLIDLLKDTDLHVRFHAAMALSALGTGASIPPLVQMLADNADDDPFIRHAAVSGLAGIGNIESLSALKSHNSNSVRIGAVVALRRLASTDITSFLGDNDGRVVLEAARAIHDDFGIPEALPALASLLNETPHADNEALMRRVLNASLRVGEPANARALLTFAGNDAREETLQLEALDILYTWAEPPILDRVERRYRLLPKKEPEVIASILREFAPRLLDSQKSGVIRKTLQLLEHYGIDLDPSDLQRRLALESSDTSERIESLRFLARQPRQAEKAFRTAFESKDDALRAEALRLLSARDEASAVRRIEAIIDGNEPLRERQDAMALLGTMRHPKAAQLLEENLESLERGETDDGLRLDVFLAAREAGVFEDRLTAISKMAGEANQIPHTYSLKGGDAARGEVVFMQHGAAQCVRCHTVRESTGSTVGPSLDGVGDRLSRDLLLESLVDPGKRLAEGYDGANGVSLMPPMGSILNPLELRDLVEYLANL